MFSVFKNINRFAGKSKLIDGFAIFFARYIIYLMILFLFIFVLLVNNFYLFVYPLISGLFAAFIIDKLIYIFFREKRPAELKSTNILIPVPKNPSFPSRHASLLFGISFYLFFYNTLLAVIFVVCSCFVGVARVFSGVHWFRDIMAGVLVGILSVLIIYNLAALIR